MGAAAQPLDAACERLDPVRRPGEFVFVEGGEPAEATVREDEGLTVVLRRERADELGLAYDYVAAWITLRVDSTLEQVGLTALFSRALADAGIGCNALAGLATPPVPTRRRPGGLRGE